MDLKLDLGCGLNKKSGYIGLDKEKLPGVDIVFEIKDKPFPFENNVFDEIRAYDSLEHVCQEYVIFMMNEIYRILKPDGLFYFRIPSTDGRGAWQDPTHRSWWNENTLRYFCLTETRHLERYSFYGIKTAFEVIKIKTSPKTDYGVCWVIGEIKAKKPLNKYLGVE